MIEIVFSFIISIIPFWLYWNYHFYTQKRFIPEKKEGILWLDIWVLLTIPYGFFILFEEYIGYIGIYLLGYLFFYLIIFMEWKKNIPILKKAQTLSRFCGLGDERVFMYCKNI